MNRAVMRAGVSLISTAMVLLATVGASAASADDEPVSVDGIVLDSGETVGIGDEIEFSFGGEKPDVDASGVPAACPEVNDPPKYKVKGTPLFMPDRGNPKSTWLLPRQSVNWAITGSHTFTWDIGGSYEAEAKWILGKAKVTVDTKISNAWTWTGSQTVTDTNTTNNGYRAVLGQVGWKLTTTKTWIAAPCKAKTKTIVIKAPRRGDISIGRQNS
ncbi:hypothetical protein ACFYW8_44490 [Streptomyces sp. NPDC002742]|uniref:hypothetical protein n=1 Tax=Streptomyces sp. NPDC002742 TaxID=3364663 RepID=UPI0036B441E8